MSNELRNDQSAMNISNSNAASDPRLRTASNSGPNTRNSTSNSQTPSDGVGQGTPSNPQVQEPQPNIGSQPSGQQFAPNIQTTSDGVAEDQRPHMSTNPQPNEHRITNIMRIDFGRYFRRLRLDVMKTYLEQVESRDKICRAIQYGSKFVSGGEAGVAHDIDVSTGLARKVFRLLKSINELEALSKRPHKSLPVMLVDKSNHTLMAIYFALDNLVWAGRIGIYKNKQHTDFLANLSLYFFLGGSACNSLTELHNLALHGQEYKQSVEHKKKVHGSALSLLKSSMDVVVAIGLLNLAKKRITPRITGACGIVSSLITCYELFQSASHEHAPKSHVL